MTQKKRTSWVPGIALCFLIIMALISYIQFLSHRLYGLPLRVVVTDHGGNAVSNATISWKVTSSTSGFWWLEDVGVSDSKGVLNFVAQSFERSSPIFGGHEYHNFSGRSLMVQAEGFAQQEVSIDKELGKISLDSFGENLAVVLEESETNTLGKFRAKYRAPGIDWFVPVFQTQDEALKFATAALEKFKEYKLGLSVVERSPELKGNGYIPTLEIGNNSYVRVWISGNGDVMGLNFRNPNALNTKASEWQSWVVSVNGDVVYTGPITSMPEVFSRELLLQKGVDDCLVKPMMPEDTCQALIRLKAALKQSR